MRRDRINVFRLLALLALAAISGASVLACSCGDDDDDSGAPDDDTSPDDDTTPDHGADDDTVPGDDDDDTAPDDDAGDDDTGEPFEGIVPTTLDVTIVPVEDGDTWVLGDGPGDPHVERNDLGAAPTRDPDGADPLSAAYFLSIADPQLVDEESPTRLTFLDDWWVLFGAFESVFRPQEDLTPHQFNAMIRTANRLQSDYGRDFDLALVLGDGTDNAQFNELQLMIDLLDGTGVLAGDEGWARPDSGFLDLNLATGRNRGERNFGWQETDADGHNINHFNRPGLPNSNADFRAHGLRRSDESLLPWYFAIGNHDVLNNGGFVPGGKIGYFTADDYTGGWSRMGYIPGIGAVVEYLLDHPDQKIITWGGLYGFFVDWRTILWLLTLDENWEKDIDPRFDVERYVNGTPDDPGDDGVAVTPDPLRWFLGHAGVVPVVADAGHGFADHNDDGEIDAADGGWYRIDAPDKAVPIRYLVLDSMDAAVSSEGGYGRAQLNWLEDELDEAQEDGMLVVVASHHPTETVLIGAERFQDLLHAHPNVILHLVGHGHRNKTVAYPGVDAAAGYWEVQTPSICSFPQQSRIFEIVDNRDGTGTIYSTLFDHYPIDGDDPDALAVKGRELGFESYLVLGYDGGGFHGYGGPGDRNLALKFQLTEDMADVLAAIPSGGPVTSTDVLGTLF